jgi:ABC-type xylose transport system permease subunit
VSSVLLRRIRPEQFREVILFLVVIGLLLFFSFQIDSYFNARSVNRLTTGLAIPLVVAVGQVLVVLTRNIDLSVSSVCGLSAYMVGTLLTRQNDLHPVLALVVAMLIGVVLGAINGLIVAYGGVPAIITTLGTLALYRVVLVEFSGARTVTTADLPDWMNDVPSATLVSAGGYDLRLMVGIALLVVILGQLTLRYLPFGRRLYAIGSNPDAARTAGLPVKRDVFLFHPFRHVGRVGRIHVPYPLRQHHGDCCPGARAPGCRGCRGWRCQHLRWIRFDDRRTPGCAHDRDPAAKPVAVGRHQRVRQGRHPRAVDPDCHHG